MGFLEKNKLPRMSNISDIQQKSIFSRIKQSISHTSNKKKVIMTIGVIIVLLLGISIYDRYFSHGSPILNIGGGQLFSGNLSSNSAPEEKKVISQLDGSLYLQDDAQRHPLAIMIENHPDARPQSGLDKASIVYEAIAEGGITRFMAVYGPNVATKIGPVRSARTYYLDWALEYDAYYTHVGGNIDALDLIPKIGIKDLDQFRYGDRAFWREPQAGKATEHTMYTNGEKLYEIASQNKWKDSSFTPMSFKENPPKESRPATNSISIDFSTDSYKVKWVYNPENNNYDRSMAGSAHFDGVSKSQLIANNIVIQEVNRTATVTRINENGWTMDTIGSGNAKIVHDGKVTEVTWKKTDRNSRTKFFGKDANEIQFNPGVTWYEIVPPGTAVTVN